MALTTTSFTRRTAGPWSATATTSGYDDNQYHGAEYRFSTINAFHKIPPYSHINSCTIVGEMSRTKPSSNAINGEFFFCVGDKGGGSGNSTTLALNVDINWKKDNPSTITIDGLYHYYDGTAFQLVSSETANAGNLSYPGVSGFLMHGHHVYAFSQTFTSRVTINWTYTIPQIYVGIKKEGKGTVSGEGYYDYTSPYAISIIGADTGYTFTGWSDNNINTYREFSATDISNISSYITTRTYTAIFTPH